MLFGTCLDQGFWDPKRVPSERPLTAKGAKKSREGPEDVPRSPDLREETLTGESERPRDAKKRVLGLGRECLSRSLEDLSGHGVASTSFGWRLTPLSMTVRCDDNLAQGDCCLAQRDCCGDALGQAAKAVCCRYFSVPTCLREKPLRSFAPLDKRGRLSPRGLWSGWAFVAGVFAGVGEAGIHQGSF